MHNMNDYREARKKDIMGILTSNPNQAILLLKLLPSHHFKTTLESILEKHIVPRFCSRGTDALVYKIMETAHNEWKKHFDIEIGKMVGKERESYELSVQLGRYE